MNEEQKRKFKAWLDTTGRVYRDDCRDAWEACLEANKAEEQKPEPSPTEMVKRLLEKGWEVESDANEITIFRDPNCTYGTSSAIRAYRKAFPRKKKVEVEVYRHKKTKSFTNNGKNPYIESSPHYKEWEKGIATFWVEEE